MGVIFDVVYNYIVKIYFFEDIEFNYYYFMNEDGLLRESFGGGCLGIIYVMSCCVLVDFIKYFINEFKVDGFCFDMMGDYDVVVIELVYKEVKVINFNMIMIGEGWRIF